MHCTWPCCCTCNCTCSLPTTHVTLYTAYIFKFYEDINVLLATSKLHRLQGNISCIFLSILYPWLLFLLGTHLCEYCMPYIHTTCCTFMASHCKHPKLACVPLKTYMAKWTSIYELYMDIFDWSSCYINLYVVALKDC